MSLNYRKDIDGLRTLAVIPVVFFHSGVPGFSGGFVGVDVFFVISGFLITGIIIKENNAGKFSISGFYERRIRRIFPALFAMIVFVLALAPLSLLPSEYRTLPREIIGAILFVSNIVYWRQSGYFGASAEEKPLLHTWSLGVEEQFYIFAPLVLWVLFRYARRALVPAIVAFALVSFGLSVTFTPGYPTAAFYLLPTRAWELLAGALLATGTLKVRSGVVSETLSLAGLLLILFSVFTYSADTGFPGYAAAIPVLGATLILLTGERSRVGVLLSLRPMVFIGLLSYSLYLWHWPLIVFFRDWGWIEAPIGRIAVIAASFAAAWLSWRFIETPFRNRVRWSTAALVRAAGLGALLLISAAGATQLTDGWPSRFSLEAVRFDAARDDISPSRRACHVNDGLRAPERLCSLGGDHPRLVVWGDSHGVEIAQAIAETGLPVLQATYSSCPPALGYPVEIRPFCERHNRVLLEYIEGSENIDTVLLVAKYKLYGGDAAFWDGLERSLKALKEAGKTAILLENIPTPGFDVPSALAAHRRLEFARPEEIERLAGISEGKNVVSISDMLCSGTTCSLSVDGAAAFFDDNHLSMSAARSMAPSLIQAISKAAN